MPVVEAELGQDAEIQQVAGVLVFEQMRVGFKKLGRDRGDALDEIVEGGGFGNETWDIVAGSDPHTRLVVPLGRDEKLLVHVMAPVGQATSSTNNLGTQYTMDKA